MLVIFGYKLVHKRMGRAADFCPVCCELSPFDVCAVRQAFHVYWIPLWRKGTFAHDEVCDNCGFSRHINLSKYEAISRNPQAAASELQAETNPDFRARWKERLDLEARIRNRRINPDERKAMLTEGWMAVAEYAGPGQPRPRVNVGVGLWLLAALGFLIAMVIAASSGNLRNQLLIGRIFTACAVLSVLLAGYCLVREFVRFRSKNSYDLLAKCFERLAPTASEIEAIRSQVDPQATKQLAKLKSERIVKLIEQRKIRAGPT